MLKCVNATMFGFLTIFAKKEVRESILILGNS